MNSSSTTVLLLPGYGDSGPDHWQSLWESNYPGIQRVQQRDWHEPNCKEWIDTLEMAVTRSGSNTLLVAHSLGCLLIPHWVRQTNLRIKGALLVAPPDPSTEQFPQSALSFAAPPKNRLPFPSIVVASSNDPYATLDFARRYATSWGSRFTTLGAYGHINGASGLGMWPEGWGLLQQLIEME